MCATLSTADLGGRAPPKIDLEREARESERERERERERVREREPERERDRERECSQTPLEAADDDVRETTGYEPFEREREGERERERGGCELMTW